MCYTRRMCPSRWSRWFNLSRLDSMKPVSRLSLFRVPAWGMLALALLAPAQPAGNPANHGIAVANMDPSVKPGDNFYLYANGGWIARTEIPADRAGIGVFSTLAHRRSKNVAAIIEEEAKSSAPSGSNPPQ